MAKAGSRRQIYNRSTAFHQVWCGISDSREISLQIYRDDLVKVFLRHLVDAAGAGKSRIVDQEIDSTEGIHRGFDDCLATRHGRNAGGLGDRRATGSLDLIDNGLCDRCVAAATGGPTSQVVDNHLSAIAG